MNTLCDTTGMAYPTQVARLTEACRQRFAGTPLTLHFHNTRGMGLANVLAGIAAGADRFDASFGGIGGCPYAFGATGSVCTEEIVHALQLMGYDAGVDLPRGGDGSMPWFSAVAAAAAPPWPPARRTEPGSTARTARR